MTGIFLRNWRLIGLALLLTALGIQTWRLSSEKAHSAALEAKSALQVATYREAYERSVAQALADKIAKEKSYEAARKTGDANYTALSDRYRTSVLRFQLDQADSSRAGKGDLPISTDATGLSDAGACPTGFSITEADALKTADLAAYAMAAHEWVVGVTQ